MPKCQELFGPAAARNAIKTFFCFAAGALSEDSHKIRLVRLVWPDKIVSVETGTLRHLARYLRQALLAAPSTGAAVSLIFKASPCIPAMLFCDARGCILILKLTPSE